MEQQRYQVRFEWGIPGAQVIGTDADVIVWVDAIEEPGSPITNSDALAAAVPNSRVLLTTGLPTAAAVAQWIVDYQVRFTRPVLVDGQTGADVTVTAAVGALEDENKIARIDLTAKFNDETVLGKAQVRVNLA